MESKDTLDAYQKLAEKEKRRNNCDVVEQFIGRRHYTQCVYLETQISLNYIPKTQRDCVINSIAAMSLSYIQTKHATIAS